MQRTGTVPVLFEFSEVVTCEQRTDINILPKIGQQHLVPRSALCMLHVSMTCKGYWITLKKFQFILLSPLPDITTPSNLHLERNQTIKWKTSLCSRLCQRERLNPLCYWLCITNTSWSDGKVRRRHDRKNVRRYIQDWVVDSKSDVGICLIHLSCRIFDQVAFN